MANQKFTNWQSALTQYREEHGVSKIPKKGSDGYEELRKMYDCMNCPTPSPTSPVPVPVKKSGISPTSVGSKVRKTRAKKSEISLPAPEAALKIVIPVDETVPVRSEIEGEGMVVKPKRKPRVKKEILVE